MKPIRTLIIGDIHGNYDALYSVLEKVNFNITNDRVICIGDYIDGWDKSFEVVDTLLEIQKQSNFENIYLLGNHDKWFLDILVNDFEHIRNENYLKTKYRNWYTQGGKQTLDSYLSYDDSFIQIHLEAFFKNLKHYQIMGHNIDEEKKRLFLKRIDYDIEKYGYHVTYVMEEKEFTPFGYSTGLYRNFGIPEVFVSGLPNGLTNTLITNYAETFKDSSIPFNEKMDNLIDCFWVYLIPVESSLLEEKVLVSIRLYDGNNFHSVQIIYPDLNGIFPGDEGYDYDMEIFGKIKEKNT